MRIEWSDKLSVGYRLIDEQHKELIGRINMLLTAMSAGQGKDKLNDIMIFIEDYVVIHFNAEEKLMRDKKYPDYEKHKKDHEKFVADFMSKKAGLEKEKTSSADVIKIYNWLADWVANHIKCTDFKYGPFIK